MNLLFNRLRLMRAFIALVNDPTKTDEVFKIADLGRAARGPLVRETVERVSRDPGLQALFSERYNKPIPPLQALETLPRESFGYAFARHMLDRGLAVDFFPVPDGTGMEQYMIERGRKSHDFWHVLTGFDTVVAGEIGLQGFTLAQVRAPFSAILIAGGILHAILKSPGEFQSLIDQLFEGYQMGLRAVPLLGVPLEEALSENLDELRNRLRITPHTA